MSEILPARKQTSKGSGSRKKDQNMCKKYNAVALSVMVKKLKLGDQIQEYKKFKHRQDFFVLMVMYAQKADKLAAFKKYYSNDIERLKSTSTQQMKKTFKDSADYRKNQALLEAIGRSFKSMELLGENKVEDSVKILFDLKNLRNKKFLERSI